jgi:hypothetical protein
VRLTVDDRHIDVTCRGSSVSAEVGDLPIGKMSLRTAKSNYFVARRLSRFLVRASLKVEITRHGRTVLEVGAGVHASPLARILGIANVRLVRSKGATGDSR